MCSGGGERTAAAVLKVLNLIDSRQVKASQIPCMFQCNGYMMQILQAFRCCLSQLLQLLNGAFLQVPNSCISAEHRYLGQLCYRLC
jgi:hypothetical protein